ncbi:transcription initiation factor TFIID subunit 4 isoform X1 [Ictalurus punctatus]|uniref:Transcription initiation factor TFIID subunit 4 isoform X1 n=1 Tax=Ictalurus punctatus TaxID=7998 RepID=A0A9F7TEM2_ICTPU|nr:transcription initiation factor TFIID subunit 4 isoform X1 [Ictalurus punctatus]
MVTTLPGHEVKLGTSTVQTLDGGDAMDPRSESTPASSGSSSDTTASAPVNVTVPVVNNGPGIAKGLVTASSTSNTVIQASFVNAPSAPGGTATATIRSSMQPATLTINGNNSNASCVLTAAPLTHAQPPVNVSVSPAVPIKAESPQTVIQSAAHTGSPQVSPGAAKGAGLMHATTAVRGGAPVTGGGAPVTAAAAGGVRTIAPQQVLAPRLPQSTPGHPSIHNIQLPPGMVLVRSEAGQLLMIPQQVLAHMQATRAATPASTTPGQVTSTQHVTDGSFLLERVTERERESEKETEGERERDRQTEKETEREGERETESERERVRGREEMQSSYWLNHDHAGTPGATIMARPVTPTTIIKQGSPTTSSTTAPTLQRPPVQPASVGSVLAVQPGTAQRMVTPTTGTSVTLATETMENVKKCKNFLSTLIKLATSAKQSSQTAANVKDLVKNLLEGTIEAEDFTSRLYKELNSSPQPYLVPFLKRSLPALRKLTPDSLAFIQQSQGLQPTRPAATVVLTNTTTANAATVATATPAASVPSATPSISAGTAATIASAAVATAPRTLTQPSLATTSQPASLVLQSQQQGAIVKSPQVTLATPMVTLRGQPHSRIVVGQPQVQVKQLNTVAVKPGMVSGAKVSPSPVAFNAAQKNKLKDASGGTFKDDDDINDVASMAGVNLSEESARILATNSELVGAVTRSCKDEAFLFSAALQRRILDIGKRFGVTDLGPEVVNLVSHATQQRLQNLLEKVTVIAQQKNMNYKEDARFEQMTDVRAQLKFFEQLDQLEKQKKEEQEREILMKAAKSRSRQEDPEQLRLKQKAKEMQQQELAQIRQRDANLTALAAIGPRKKRKLDSPALGTDAEGSGSSASSSAGLSGGASRQFTRQRITRVNLRDLLFCLENEKESTRSQLLYRALLK